MSDPLFTVRAGASGPIVQGTPGNVLAFDSTGQKVQGVPAPSGGGVTSFNTRTGAVVPATNDYAASQVSNDSSVAGTGVKGALNTLLGLITGSGVSSFNTRTGAVVPATNDYAASQVSNDSSVAGTGVKGALDTLLASIGALVTGVSSFNSRAGAVVPVANDYSAQQIFQLDIQAVAVASTGNITLSGEQTIDGVLTASSRVLVWLQTTATQNGIYVSAAGAWTRATDQDVTGEFRPGVFFKINGGTLYGGNLGCLLTPQQPTAIVVGTTPLLYGVTFPPPIASVQDGFVAIAKNGVLTYQSALLSNTFRATAQTASVAATVMLTAPIPDLYFFDVYLEVTTAGTAGTLTATFSYTDDIGATTETTATLTMGAQGRQSTRFAAYVASGNVSVATTYTLGTGTPAYTVTARAQRAWSSQ